MNIYIDCGYYHGKGLSLFKRTREYKDDFLVYAFDPSTDHKSTEKFIFSKNAVWIYDGTIKFHKSSRRKGQANGLYHNPMARKEIIEEVPCIDFSRWIIKTFNRNDNIILKMDIEGAEKDVLKKMVEDGSIDYIKIAYIEPHRINDNDEEYTKVKSILREKIDFRNAIEWCYDKYRNY